MNVNRSQPTQPRHLDIESDPTLPQPIRTARGKTAALIGTGVLLIGGGATAAGILLSKHKHTPAPAPTPAPARAPVHAPAPAPAPAVMHAPPPANNNITGFVNVMPFNMAPVTAFWTNQSITGGRKYAVVLTDANETCATMTAGPVRSNGIQEVDACQLVNGTAIEAQNGRIVKNGQQFPSTQLSLNGTVNNNGTLSGNLAMNTTNDGFITGNFVAQPCATLVLSNFCELDN